MKVRVAYWIGLLSGAALALIAVDEFFTGEIDSNGDKTVRGRPGEVSQRSGRTFKQADQETNA